MGELRDPDWWTGEAPDGVRVDVERNVELTVTTAGGDVRSASFNPRVAREVADGKHGWLRHLSLTRAQIAEAVAGIKAILR